MPTDATILAENAFVLNTSFPLMPSQVSMDQDVQVLHLQWGAINIYLYISIYLYIYIYIYGLLAYTITCYLAFYCSPDPLLLNMHPGIGTCFDFSMWLFYSAHLFNFVSTFGLKIQYSFCFSN